jgi:hypothetical protein
MHFINETPLIEKGCVGWISPDHSAGELFITSNSIKSIMRNLSIRMYITGHVLHGRFLFLTLPLLSTPVHWYYNPTVSERILTVGFEMGFETDSNKIEAFTEIA